MNQAIQQKKFCPDCGKELNIRAELCPGCGVRQFSASGSKNKIAAGLLGIFLGGIGLHKFYLGQVGWGILYLLTCWTFIPGIVGFIEGIIYLTMTDQSFSAKYA